MTSVETFSFFQILYSRIAMCLWKSSRQLERQLNASTCCPRYQELTRGQSLKFKPSIEKKVRTVWRSLNSYLISIPDDLTNIHLRTDASRKLKCLILTFAWKRRQEMLMYFH